MARSDLNNLLKTSWPGIAGEIKRTLPELLRAPQDGTGGRIRLSLGFITDATKIQWTGLEERLPGYVSPFGEGQWNFAAPMSAQGWGVRIAGKVVGTLHLGKTTIPLAQLDQTIEIRRLRLEARATLLDVVLDMPRLGDLTIEPTAEIRLSGWLNLAVNLDQTTRRGDLTNTLFYEIDLLDTPARVPGHPRQIRLRGKLRLNLKPEAGLVIENGTIFDGNERYDLPKTTIPLPDLLAARKNLPRLWGENRPQTVTPAGPAGFDFLQAAQNIDRSFEKHAPRSVDLNRRLGLVADNRYPPSFRPCSGIPAAPLKLYGIGDSAIWTGHLLAAQAFRYAAAKTDAERQAARRQALWVLEAIEKLFAVPAAVMGRRGLLSRAALPEDLAGETQEFYTPPGGSPDAKQTYAMADPPDPERTKYYLRVPLGGEIWYGKGRDTDPPSRDSHTGVVLGLACAYKLIGPGDAEIKARVGGLLTDMLGYLLDNGWNVPTPRGPLPARPPVTDFRIITSFFHQFHQQLAMLRVGKLVEDESGAPGGRFSRAYAEASAGASQAWISVWVDCLEPVRSYFKFNLDHACVALLAWLAGPGEPRAAYLRMFRMLRRTTGHHRNPYFHLLWALARGSGGLDEITPGSVGPGGAPVTVRQEIRYLLWEWSRRLNPAGGVPGPNCLPLSKTPDLAYMRRLYDEEEAREYNPGDWRSVSALPCDKRIGRDMDFMWQRDPFQTGLSVDEATGKVSVDEGDFREGVLEAPGVDFLLACWMAAYLGVV